MYKTDPKRPHDTLIRLKKHLLAEHSEEAKLSHALQNINRRHFLPTTKGFSNKRQWDFATSQHTLFRTSLSTIILFTTLFHIHARGFVLHDPYIGSIMTSTKQCSV